MTSWIVPFVQKNKDDPRSHTNQHEPKHSYLELDPTFEACYALNCGERQYLYDDLQKITLSEETIAGALQLPKLEKRSGLPNDLKKVLAEIE